MDSDRRMQGQRWLDSWAVANTRLEQERWQHVEALDDDAAWDEAQALSALWEPEWEGDRGEGLVLQQDVFGRARFRQSL
jgi:hypothetical protein